MPYRSVNPATGEVITTFANHTDAELQSALSVANSLYKSDCPIQPRLEVLARLADLLDCRSEELVLILTQEMGKAHFGSTIRGPADGRDRALLRNERRDVACSREDPDAEGDAWGEYHPPFEAGEILFEQGGTNRPLMVVLECEIEISNRDTLEGNKRWTSSDKEQI